MRVLNKHEKWMHDRLSAIAKSSSPESADARLLRNKLVAAELSQSDEKFAADLIYGE